MKKLEYVAVCAMLTMGICVAQDSVNIIHGTIRKVDSCGSPELKVPLK